MSPADGQTTGELASLTTPAGTFALRPDLRSDRSSLAQHTKILAGVTVDLDSVPAELDGFIGQARLTNTGADPTFDQETSAKFSLYAAMSGAYANDSFDLHDILRALKARLLNPTITFLVAGKAALKS